MTAATSSAFNITAGSATKLAYTTVPSTGTAGTAFSVTVESQDVNGNASNLVAASTTITLTKATGGGSLSGTLTGTIASGASSVTIATPVYSKSDAMTLTATASGGDVLTAVTSGSITFSAGAATKLAFLQQPTSAVGGATISPAVTVRIEDANGNLVTTDNTTTVTLAIGTNPGSGTLTGGGAATASGGIATFSGLSINKSGTGYTLGASSSPVLTAATSSAFNITAGSATKLAYTTVPSTGTAGTAL